MPRITNGNTHLSIIMIAEYAAQFILQSAGPFVPPSSPGRPFNPTLIAVVVVLVLGLSLAVFGIWIARKRKGKRNARENSVLEGFTDDAGYRPASLNES